MSQIGVPQKNILEPIAGGYPATTPVAAGKSALTLGQTLVDDANQETGGRDSSDLLKVPRPYRVAVQQPDLPKANTQHKTLVANGSVDANGNHITDSDAIFSSGVTGGPFDANQSARARALANGIDAALIETSVVLGQPKTGGAASGYGAMSGGTPGGAVAASRVIQDLTFTSKAPGAQGNAVKIEYLDTVLAGAEAVTVTGNLISVAMEDGVSTAQQIADALALSQPAMGLVSVLISGTASDPQTAFAALFLQSGANTASDGDGALTNSKGSFTAINRTGSRNHAMLNVIHRPGDNQAAMLF